MKAMGADSDQEVVSLVGQEEALQALLLPSLQVRGCHGGSGGPRQPPALQLGNAARSCANNHCI